MGLGPLHPSRIGALPLSASFMQTTHHLDGTLSGKALCPQNACSDLVPYPSAAAGTPAAILLGSPGLLGALGDLAGLGGLEHQTGTQAEDRLFQYMRQQLTWGATMRTAPSHITSLLPTSPLYPSPPKMPPAFANCAYGAPAALAGEQWALALAPSEGGKWGWLGGEGPWLSWQMLSPWQHEYIPWTSSLCFCPFSCHSRLCLIASQTASRRHGDRCCVTSP